MLLAADRFFLPKNVGEECAKSDSFSGSGVPICFSEVLLTERDSDTGNFEVTGLFPISGVDEETAGNETKEDAIDEEAPLDDAAEEESLKLGIMVIFKILSSPGVIILLGDFLGEDLFEDFPEEGSERMLTACNGIGDTIPQSFSPKSSVKSWF